MKTLYISILALLVAVTGVRAQEGSPLRFAADSHNFGDIREEAGPVSHVFSFVNRGQTPVAIDRVVSSCGCTTPDYPRTPIAPGAAAQIKVTFDPTGMPGEFSKSIGVVSGGGANRNFLIVTGNVVPRPKTVEEEYPYDMGGGLRLGNTLLAFGSVAQGGTRAMAVDYINTSGRPVTLALEPDESSGLLGAPAPETIPAGGRGEITMTYDLSAKTAYGSHHDVLRPVIDGARSGKTIYAAMTGIDDFTGVDTDRAPRFFLNSSFHDFGEIHRRAMPYTFRVTASNEGAQTAPEGLQTTLRGGMTIAPGAELPFEIMLYTNRYQPGEARGTINIVVDDPMRPTREIRTAAIIRP